MESEQSFFRVLSQYAGGASAIVKNPLTEHVPGFKYSSLFRPKSLIGTPDKANISTNRAKFFFRVLRRRKGSRRNPGIGDTLWPEFSVFVH